jgi:O-antigen/teichoic acid export membrane protein
MIPMRNEPAVRAAAAPPADAARDERSVPRRVWSGTGLLVAGRFWGSACTLATLWLLAQHLAAPAFGRFTFYLAIFALLDSLADFGTGQIAVQRTAHDPAAVPAVLAAGRRIRLAAGLVGVALVAAVALVYGEPGAGWIVLASLYPVTHVLELSSTVFKNRIDWRIPVAMRATASGLSLAFVLLLRFVARDEEPAHYLCAVAAGSATANGLLHLAARPYLPRGAGRVAPAAGVLAAALPLGLAGLCQQAYFYVDNLFVRALCGSEAVGHYNVGVRVLSWAIMVALFASAAALPWLTRAHAEGRLGDALQRLGQPLLALAGAGAGLALPWSERILGLFGEEFVVAAGSLRWLFGAVVVIYVGAPLVTGLVATGHTRLVLVVAAAGLALNLAGNTWLVPIAGIDGAAQATLATEAGVALGAVLALRRCGVRWPLGMRSLLWLAGPAAFAVTAWASGRLL